MGSEPATIGHPLPQEIGDQLSGVEREVVIRRNVEPAEEIREPGEPFLQAGTAFHKHRDVGFDVDTYDYDPVGVVIDHPTPSRPPPRSLRVRRQTAPKRPRRRDIPGRSE